MKFKVGDRIIWNNIYPGTVRAVYIGGNDEEQLSVKWDDGHSEMGGPYRASSMLIKLLIDGNDIMKGLLGY